jgi:putative salt-induced outer membrane protein YdiY
MFTKFYDSPQIFGSVMVSNNVVTVTGPEQLARSRDELAGITSGGKRELSLWSGKLTAGFNIQSGNTRQANVNASAELARRTPATRFELDYLGNFGEVEGNQTANNQRVNVVFDVRLDRHWFLRPLLAEYYTDPLANLDARSTVGGGAGYNIFDRDNLEWDVALGPAYQYSRFRTVEAGQSASASTASLVLQTNFKADITRRLKFIQIFSANLMSEEAGQYAHHSETKFEFEIKRHLDLDLSLVWDYLQNPQVESSGQTPLHNDVRLILGLGVKF